MPLMAYKFSWGQDMMCNVGVDGGPEHDGVTEFSSIAYNRHSAML